VSLYVRENLEIVRHIVVSFGMSAVCRITSAAQAATRISSASGVVKPPVVGGRQMTLAEITVTSLAEKFFHPAFSQEAAVSAGHCMVQWGGGSYQTGQ
jgi:hypothetical protein